VVCIKSAPGHITPNLCFCLQWDLRVTESILEHPGCESQPTIFSARVGPVRIPKKRTGTYYAKLVFLHSVGYAGHKVLSGASES
jgi:hypothetical protein